MRTVAGMIGVIIAVLAGSTVGLVIAAASERSLALALAIPFAVGVLIGLLRYEHVFWQRSGVLSLGADDS